MFNDHCTAQRIMLTLEALSIKADWMHIAALAYLYDTSTKINARDFLFTDTSALRRNNRAAYLVELPLQQPLWLTQE